MPGTTPSLALPYPSSTDAPDGPGAIYNLATRLDSLFEQAAWTPSIGNITWSSEMLGAWQRVGNYVTAHAFGLTAASSGLISTSKLALPKNPTQPHGIPYQIGTFILTRKSDSLRSVGRVTAGIDPNPGLASFWADVAVAAGSYPGIGNPVSMGTNVPFPFANGSDQLYIDLKLSYYVGP